MKNLAQAIDQKFEMFRNISERWLAPLTVLTIRFYVASIFFKSGFGKLQDTLNGNFSDVLFLFTEIHPVPLLPPVIAAVLGIANEVIFGALLAVGLFGRLAAFVLLSMALVIQFAIPAEYGMANTQHYYWMMLLAVPLFFGAGKLSGDHFLLKYIRAK
jgi:putative oxidoreductase|tara:strand:+ start:144116 stop:144589 length:474 start_codon:yes stop_codon:yes gene_type:complete